MGVILAYFALAVWVFKQIHWKHYVFGIVALALTPMVLGVISVVFFELMGLDDDIGLVLVILTYIVVIGVIISNLTKESKNQTSIVLIMYLQVFLPVLPFFVWGLTGSHYNPDEFENLIYVSWVIGLISIGTFKYLYKKFELLPLKK
jgi:hypothetical protein